MRIFSGCIFHTKQWKEFSCGDSGIKRTGDLNVPLQKAQILLYVLWIDLICLLPPASVVVGR